MPAQTEQRIAENHYELYALHALLNGGEVHEKGGLRWINAGPAHHGQIMFPTMEDDAASALLDEMMESYRRQPADGIGCWSLLPAPEHLGARLLARGFQPGWQPCWMSMALDKALPGFSFPEGLSIEADNTTDIEPLTDLPYSGGSTKITPALIKAYPQKAQRFLARMHGEIVGQSALFFSDVAGIYNVGVLQAFRGRGLGKALTAAACQYAREQGYTLATLNASDMGQPIYEQMGFKKLGNGMTWWMNGMREVSPQESAFAEAVACGHLERLGHLPHGNLDQPIANGMSLIALAAYCHQPDAAEWLVHHGAAYTALDAWDLGWIERAADMLTHNPQEVNRLYGEFRYTLLHIAAQRNDVGLARLAIQFHPDLTIRDRFHDSTAAGWANFFKRREIAGIITQS
ncbi:GNAT family N-acetyltransferase [Chitinophaga sedimenti]|uniref:GNAT family N-acetyltransferase n=1 Tax=Chitinophaga sedimenti TaxID=2033606 RepID=UPI0020031DA5|nr:GNAT family N-acetyltransferase [Chitinophaga sedimenti]MCK7555493.1 GNAT family N-acetyltransferase [Chitinophaga sedimenti]